MDRKKPLSKDQDALMVLFVIFMFLIFAALVGLIPIIMWYYGFLLGVYLITRSHRTKMICFATVIVLVAAVTVWRGVL